MVSAETDIFLESKNSRKKRRNTVYGVGIVDVKFRVQAIIDGSHVSHRAYKVWKNILQRCCHLPAQHQNPSYAGCSVAPEWLHFSSFHEWWKVNFREGWQIDKDLLIPGNKVYSPETCIFVPNDLNSFVISRDAKRGPCPIGSTFDHKYKVYKTSISIGKGKKIHLGIYKNAQDAYAAWLNAKLKLAERFKPVCEEIHPQLYDSLLTKIRSIR